MVEESTTQLFTVDEQEKAALAREAYLRGDFQDALNVLTALKQKRPNDFRIKHNIALCTYALSGKTRTSEFQSKLSQFEAERKETKASIFTLKYNQAVILFHQQQYKKSLDILNKLKDDLDAQTELKCLALIAECYLNLRNPQSAIMVADSFDALEPDSKWTNIRQSIYARAYILSLCVGQSRPKMINNLDLTSTDKFINAAFETRGRKCANALKLLSSENVVFDENVHQTGESIKTMHYNNLAVIFFKMEKFTLSSLYLAKASQANDDDLQQLPRVDSQLNGRPLITLGLSKKCQLLRNFGVVKLFAGQNKEAFELLVKSVDTHFDSSRAWFRIAEACIAHYCSTLETRDSCIISEIGEGCARLAIAETSDDEVPVDTDSLTPTLSLSFGISCIENALVLLHKRVSDDDDFCQLHQSILLGGAFIALRLKRFSKTAEYAKKCIQIKPSILASFYLSEALINLDMIDEAISVLTGALDSVKTDDTIRVKRDEVYSTQCALLSNLSAANATNGSIDLARKNLNDLKSKLTGDVSPKTILLGVYISLREGKRLEALQILRTRSLAQFS